MRFANFFRSFNLTTLAVVVPILITAIALGRFVPAFNVGTREIVIILMILAASVLFFAPTDNVIRLGFALWIITFGFGWRTIRFGDSLNFHPSEVLAWLLFLVMITRSVVRHVPLDYSIPLVIILFMVFVIFGILDAFNYQIVSTPTIIQEAKVLFVLLPTYYVVKWLVITRADWERAIGLSILVAVYVSLLGAMDLFLPGLSQRLAGSSTIETFYVSEQQGFGRVGFIFYGSFTAGFFIFTFLGITIHHFLTSEKSRWQTRLVILGAVLLECFAIYFSGYRGLWFAVVSFVAAYAMVKRRAWVLIGVGLAAIPLLPDEFTRRLLSLFDYTFADSSQFKHFDRASYALDWVQQFPLTGVGLGGSGYVHSDLIQIAGNLGIPGLLIFLFLIGNMLLQLYRLTRKVNWIGEYAAALFASVIGLLVLLAGEGVINFIQITIPVWFLFGLSYKLFEFSAQEKAESTDLSLAPESISFQPSSE